MKKDEIYNAMFEGLNAAMRIIEIEGERIYSGTMRIVLKKGYGKTFDVGKFDNEDMPVTKEEIAAHERTQGEGFAIQIGHIEKSPKQFKKKVRRTK